MRHVAYLLLGGLLATISLSSSAEAAGPSALPAVAVSSKAETALIEVGGHWYPDARDAYDEYDGPLDDEPPPPPARHRYVPAPPAVGYAPPVYGWIAPPPPSSCGVYRYWDGEGCADARDDPPYIGPRW